MTTRCIHNTCPHRKCSKHYKRKGNANQDPPMPVADWSDWEKCLREKEDGSNDT